MKIEMCEEFFYRAENAEDIKEFNTSKENVLRNNPNIKIYAGEWIKIKLNNYTTHIVKPAETIKQIANVYNVSIEKLLSDNNLETNKLFIGQQLKIFK